MIIFKQNHYAFTLAEVLITLGIIGVVAAMTMPTLIANHQKKVLATQLKSTVKNVSTAIQKYLYDEGVDKISDTKMFNNPEELKNFFKEYFIIGENCGEQYYVENKNCFAPTYTSMDKTLIANMNNFYCDTTITIPNGTTICADMIIDDLENPLTLELDLNGTKPPNTFGKDWQVIFVANNGKLHDQTWEDNGLNYNSSYTGAFGQIMADGWEIKYY